MRKELEALETNHTWDIIELPQGKKPIGCKWVCESVEKYKARLVIRGDAQVEGVGFNETLSPMVKLSTVKCLIAGGVKKKWPLFLLYVNNAFIHGDNLDEEV